MGVITVLLEKRMGIEEDLVEHKNDNVAGESHHLCQGEDLGIRALLLYSALRPNVRLLWENVNQTDGEEDAGCECLRKAENFRAFTAGGHDRGNDSRKEGLAEAKDDEADLRPENQRAIWVTISVCCHLRFLNLYKRSI